MTYLIWTVLVTSVILRCFGEVDAYSIQLDPSPIANVKEGENQTLCCSCVGSITPDYINWYLNNDTLGLVIDVTRCNYQTRLGQYEIHRYSISCEGTKFNLTIASISKDKDDQDTWGCDATVIGMHPPQKISTRIMVIATEPYPEYNTFSYIQTTQPSQNKSKENVAGKDGQFDEPKTVVFTWILAGVITTVAVISIAAAGCFMYRKIRNVIFIAAVGYVPYGKRRNDCVKNRAKNHHDAEQLDMLGQVTPGADG